MSHAMDASDAVTFPLEHGGAARSATHGPGRIVLTVSS